MLYTSWPGQQDKPEALSLIGISPLFWPKNICLVNIVSIHSLRIEQLYTNL